MELGSVLSGAFIMVVCALPFIMMSNNRKKKEKQLLQSLTDLAIQNNCRIDQHELLGNFVIGIDESKNFVFFYRQVKDKETTQAIDLDKIERCKVINTSRKVKHDGKSQEVLDKLELSFLPAAKDNPEIKLEFFNTDVNSQLYGELQSIERWSKFVNSRLLVKK